MSVQKSWDELQKMHRACRIVVETLDALSEAARPGVRTKELDRIARERIEKAGARPAFLGYRGYPRSRSELQRGPCRQCDRPES